MGAMKNKGGKSQDLIKKRGESDFFTKCRIERIWTGGSDISEKKGPTKKTLKKEDL